MTEEQKLLLEMVAEELGGTLHFWTCSDRLYESHKITIEYGKTKKEN